MGGDGEDLALALQLSDIFAWDIDFTSDLRNGDTFKIVVEGLYLDGQLKRYGNILCAEFVNNGESHHAYRFERGERADYYDGEGRSLKKAFLKAPLNFRRVSSGFSKGRFHPILRIYRPHHGFDYAASAGTPVSSVGDGKVIFAGVRGQYGKLVIIHHPNGWKTYYGHLSKIEKGVKKGASVDQGRIIGRVGSTGLATGPHLHYEVRIRNRPVNPLGLKLPRGSAVHDTSWIEFAAFRNAMDMRLVSITPQVVASAPNDRGGRTQPARRGRTS
jgi:murein DD-endopeptidase MepM/ murein hydrolase activator NlpD